MKGQRDLFGKAVVDGEAYARSSDPHTSHKAAKKMIISGLATRRERQVASPYFWPENRDGLTCGEVCRITKIQWNTASPRYAPLVRKGYLRVKCDAFGELTRLDPISNTEQRIYIMGDKTPEWNIYEDS